MALASSAAKVKSEAGQEQEQEAQAAQAVALAQRRRNVKIICFSSFLSLTQRIVTIQSEPMLVKDLCAGDLSQTARLLGNTAGVAGLLSMPVNQLFGKLSDSFGRKPAFLLGPLSSIPLGFLMFRFSKVKAVLLPCRVARQILQTFSNTVVCMAALADVCSGKELAVASSLLAAATGLGTAVTPFLETWLLSRTKGPRYSFLAVSALAVVQALLHFTVTPETHPLEKRTKAALSGRELLSALNPFGFLRVFTHGSQALKKMLAIITAQFYLEGKNWSDFMEIWKREHLGWTPVGCRNFVVAYGLLTVVAGIKVTPLLLRTLSPRNFTSVTNFTNLLGFVLRGSTEVSWVFLLAVIPMLPGVNGASTSALRALAQDRARAEGFGQGEFSAAQNNLRGLTSAVAPVIIGNYYSWCRRSSLGLPVGSTFAVGGLIGAALPELFMRAAMQESEFASVSGG